MKVKFEATCNVPDNLEMFLDDFIQSELNLLTNCEMSKIKNPNVISANKEKEEHRTDIIKGEICPVCGYNNEMKIIDLNDEYFTCNCPQCHSTFKVNLSIE